MKRGKLGYEIPLVVGAVGTRLPWAPYARREAGLWEVTNCRMRMRPLVLVCSFVRSSVCFAQGSWQVLSASSLSWRFEDLFFVNDSVGWAVDGGGRF